MAAKRIPFDLAGLVPLGIPREERTPEQVLVGFVAAMNRWERDAWRHRALVDKGECPGKDAAEAAIFAEFCTPKPRPYGRQGLYRHPPEYEPKKDRILAKSVVSPRRVEIIMGRAGDGRGPFRYVLLRKRGVWLIESKARKDARGKWQRWWL